PSYPMRPRRSPPPGYSWWSVGKGGVTHPPYLRRLAENLSDCNAGVPKRSHCRRESSSALETRTRDPVIPFAPGEPRSIKVLQHRDSVLSRHLHHVLEGAHAERAVSLKVDPEPALQLLPERSGIQELGRHLHGAA